MIKIKSTAINSSGNITLKKKTHNDEQIGMRPCENGDVHGNPDGVGLVQSHPKVPFSTQKQKDEHPDVHEADPS